MLVGLEVCVFVTPNQALPDPVKPGGVNLEGNQLLEDVVNQQRQLMAEAIDLDLHSCQALWPHLRAIAPLRALGSAFFPTSHIEKEQDERKRKVCASWRETAGEPHKQVESNF